MAGFIRSAYRRLAQGLPGEPPTRKDIDLPLEGKQRRDTRLPTKTEGLGGAFGSAAKGFGKVRELAKSSRSQSKGGR